MPPDHNMQHDATTGYSFKDYLPLIGMFILVIICTVARRFWLHDWHSMEIMQDGMGFFFILFGTLKVYNWHGFVEAYRSYDILAKQSITYAYVYPIIELMLGTAYLARWNPPVTNMLTLILMLIGALGVAQAMLNKQTIECACLGDLFRIPLTWISLVEDLLMALMALALLLH
jgi:hypothetical protein